MGETSVPERVTRRPIPSREAGWAAAATHRLLRAGVRPNQISVLGLLVALAAALCLILAGRSDGAPRVALLLLAAAGIPLRLLCNLLDGMLAVEGGLRSPTGELFNELPDRLADLALLAAAGYAIPDLAWGPELGWAAGATALLVAYVRTLGAAAGVSHHFTGPMAKPRRMHVLLVGCLVAAGATVAGGSGGTALAAALLIVLAGGWLTIGRRLRRIAADLAAG